MDEDINDYDKNNNATTIVKQELDKWNNFSFILRKQNRKLFEKSYENRDGKERKLLYCIAWGKDLTPQTEPQILMDLCVEAYKTKGKFLHEMDKDEVKQIMKDFK